MSLTDFLLLAVLATAKPSAEVARFHGEGGEACAERVGAVLRSLTGTAVRLREGLPTRGGFSAVDEALRSVSAEIVIHGFVRGDSLVLEAYARTQRRLIGVNKIRTAGRCGLTPRGKSALERWWSVLASRARGREPFALEPQTRLNRVLTPDRLVLTSSSVSTSSSAR